MEIQCAKHSLPLLSGTLEHFNVTFLSSPITKHNNINKTQKKETNMAILFCISEIAAIPPIPLIFDWVNKEAMAKNDCECMIPIQNVRF